MTTVMFIHQYVNKAPVSMSKAEPPLLTSSLSHRWYYHVKIDVKS